MESVENYPFFIVLTLKIVENSVENVENGFVIRWILGRGSGKKLTEKMTIGNKNFSVVLVHVLSSYEQDCGLIINNNHFDRRLCICT